MTQLARLIMIFSFQSRADWKVFVDKFVFIVRFYVSIIYIKRVEGDHLDVTRQMRGYKKYKLARWGQLSILLVRSGQSDLN